jgi:hypothetical protein
VTLSPNPVVDAANLQLWSAASSGAQVQVLNLWGQTVMVTQTQLLQGENTIALQLAGLPSGNYVVQVFSNAGSAALKFVKE